MKKTISLLVMLALFMLCLMPAAFAEGGIISPWSDENIKLNVYDSLDEEADKIALSTDLVEIALKSGRIVVDKCGNKWYGATFDVEPATNADKASGAGFYIENNTEAGVWVVPLVYCKGEEKSASEGKPVVIYNLSDSTYNDTKMQAYGTYELYAGFKGYICLPYESYGVTEGQDISKVCVRFSPKETFSQGDIKAITYDGVSIGGKKTKAFAYIGYPEEAKDGDGLPAVVLVHGGGGQGW